MRLKHIKTVIPPQNGASKVCGISYSPNNQKMAVCTANRIVLLFDENGEKRDKFPTKPVNAKFGKESYIIKGLCFSPCSRKLAIAQTDNVIFIYNIGEDWGDKKSISNKFILQSAVTAMVWVNEDIIAFGLADGKVRQANIRTNKSSPLYNTDTHVVSIALSLSGKGIITGHANGTIVRFFFEDDGSNLSQGKVCVHPCPPYALVWGNASIVAAGCDKRVIAYTKDGRVLQQFDYSRENDEHEFTCAIMSPTGSSVVFGSYDRLRVYNWSVRKGRWEEGSVKEIRNLYTITALGWKKDGSNIAAGTLCGAVEWFDCCVKRQIYKKKFELTYVGESQVIMRHLDSNERVVIKSNYGYDVEEVKILGGDRYYVAHTASTLLVADRVSNRLSEVPWPCNTGGNEKFYFDNENVCMVFNAGELSLIEYGATEILGSVRTEYMNPHVISVRLNERKQLGIASNKKISYLLDARTICLVDLSTSLTIATIVHDMSIDWLELNETCCWLLYRDKKRRLMLYDVERQTQSTILNFCNYVQWVSGSDVVVAQNRNNLCVWYNIAKAESCNMTEIKGDVVEVRKDKGSTEVIVNEGFSKFTYKLDEQMVEFNTAIEDGDYGRAILYLEPLPLSPDIRAMWSNLSRHAFENNQLPVTQRCYAALGLVSKAWYLQEILKLADEVREESGGDGMNHYKVRAKLEILKKNYKEAASIYINQNQSDEAIEMYKSLYAWEDALQIAELTVSPRLDELQREYYQWMMDTHQMERAGELKERQGDNVAAISLYMKSGMAARAARLVCNNQELLDNEELVNRIAAALSKADLHDKAGELFEKAGRFEIALENYRKGRKYQRAVELSRHAFPENVVQLEEEWGDYLVSQRQMDPAINHYIEAGHTFKAAECAIQARQWQKAVDILKVLKTGHEHKGFFKQIADHYASVAEYQLAEQYYEKADAPEEAITMYNKAGQFEKAMELASDAMQPEDMKNLYAEEAQRLVKMGKHRDAEKLYLKLHEPDLAITMYKRQRMYQDMVRLVKKFHPDLLNETHLHLAKELEAENNLRQAEHHLVEAGDWKGAVNMYRQANMWDEAYRVAKDSGGQNAGKQVAYYWAKSLGGDSAVKLLTKFGVLESAIDYATDTNSFDFAYDLARAAMSQKMPDIHLKHAMYLEDEGRFEEAESHFIEASKPKEAVLMYVHNQNWSAAQRVAESYDPDSVSDILIGQARHAFEKGDFQKCESFLLRAQRPELALKYYKEADMWQDAFRVCKEYVPGKLHILQEEYDREMADKGSGGIEDIVQKAREWEKEGNYAQAVDSYVMVTQDVTNDTQVLEKCWMRAANLSMKFLSAEKSTQIVKIIASKLETIDRHVLGAELLIQMDLYREAVDLLIAGNEWGKAQNVAKELDTSLQEYVEAKFKDNMKKQGRGEELAKVDIVGGLEMLASKGDWEKCIEVAEKQSPHVFNKYMALYAAELIKHDHSLRALDLFAKHGAPAIKQNTNIYKRIINDVVSAKSLSGSEYRVWASLRNLVHSLTEERGDLDEVTLTYFQTFLWISHYYAMRAACASHERLQGITAKLSTSLLRHTDVLPADRIFYEATIAARKVGKNNMAFVFSNKCIDLFEAIEENSLEALDYSDFLNTDVPYEIPLPDVPSISGNQLEQLKQWVLSVSLDQKVAQELPLDERGVYEASLIARGRRSEPCVITGYPVLGSKIEFKKEGYSANKDDWNNVLMAAKITRSTELQDSLNFILEWCGSPPNPSFSF